jgi:hypothetical protein
MMTDVYNAMGIEASDSQRLVDAAREVRNVIWSHVCTPCTHVFTLCMCRSRNIRPRPTKTWQRAKSRAGCTSKAPS